MMRIQESITLEFKRGYPLRLDFDAAFMPQVQITQGGLNWSFLDAANHDDMITVLLFYKKLMEGNK
jgi:hypothetical protein